jgi:hypothetical protein
MVLLPGAVRVEVALSICLFPLTLQGFAKGTDTARFFTDTRSNHPISCSSIWSYRDVMTIR